MSSSERGWFVTSVLGRARNNAGPADYYFKVLWSTGVVGGYFLASGDSLAELSHGVSGICAVTRIANVCFQPGAVGALQRQTMTIHDEPTQELNVSPTRDNVIKGVWTPLDVDLGSATHQGHVRKNNEDSYLVVRFGRSLENLATNLEPYLLERSYNITGHGMLVADGMGGMAAGEVASRLALTKLVELIVETSDWVMSLRRDKDLQTVLRRMTQRFHQIDEILRDEVEIDPSLSGMGTTLTVAGALGSDLVIGHVGDSRAYILRDGLPRQLTVDHTMAQALIDAGVATRDDPATSSMRHVLTAAIGSLGENIEPQVQRFKLVAGDQLLLCTDGLTEMVDDATIAEVLLDAKSAQSACQTLIDLALAGGGRDNVTVIVARFTAAE